MMDRATIDLEVRKLIFVIRRVLFLQWIKTLSVVQKRRFEIDIVLEKYSIGHLGSVIDNTGQTQKLQFIEHEQNYSMGNYRIGISI